METAASLFIEATEYAPDDPKAKVNTALGHLLQDQFETARAIADGLLRDDPANADAAGIRIIAAFDEQAVQDPLSIVPPENHSVGNVLLAAARWYRHRGDGASAFDKLKCAYSAQPEDLDIKAELATAMLEAIFQNTAATYGHKLTTSEREDFTTAVAMLSEVWEKAKHSEAARRFSVAAANLSVALRFSQQIDKAGTVIDEALTSAPEEPILVKQKAHVLWSRRSFPEVLTTVERLPADDVDALVMRIEALTALERYPEASQLLEQLAQTDNQKIRRLIDSSRVRALWFTGRHSEALAAAKQLVSDSPHDPASYIALTDVYTRSGDLERAREAARDGLQHTASDDGLHRLLLADAFYGLGDWDGAVEAVTPITGIEEDSQALRLRINALMRANRRQEAKQLFSSLPSAVADLPACQGAAASMSWQIGDYPAARRHLDRYLEQTPNDLRMRLLWLEVVEKLEDREAAASFLAGELSFDNADTREQLALAQLLDRCGHGERALRLAYKILRDHWSDPQAHLVYTSLCLMGRSARDAIPRPSSIEPDAAFTVHDGPDRTHTYILEADFPPDPGRDEIGPDSALAKRAIGHNAGDKIQVNESPFIPEQEIIQVKHKFLHALHRSLAEFNSLFPAERGLLGVRIDTERPDAAVDQMRPIVAQRSSAVREIFENYRQSQLPIGIIARATHDEPIDVWYGMMQNNVEIDVCLGTAPERAEALQLLSSGPPLILDPNTFWIAGVIDVLDVLERTFGPLAVTQSTIDVLRRRLVEAEEAIHRKPGSLSEHNGKIAFTAYSETQTAAALNLAKQTLQWANQHAVVVPAVPAKDLPPETWQLGECMDPPFLDTIAAASGSGRILLSEDRRFRQIAAEAAKIPGVWLQPTLITAARRGHLDRRRYSDVVVNLALAGHTLTSLDAEAFLHAVERNNWNPTGQYVRLAALLSSQRIDIKSLMTVATGFLQLLWSERLPNTLKEQLTATLLNAILAARPTEAQQIVSLLSDHGKPTTGISTRLRARTAFRDFMKQWWNENFGKGSGDEAAEQSPASELSAGPGSARPARS